MKGQFPKGGYMGKALRVDLSSGKISEEKIDPQLLYEYIGGSGLGTRLLYDETIPGLDPYDARNCIVIAVGPLTGTLVPGSGIYSITGRNTLTGLLASAQSNGFFGARLKHAGYDVLIVCGKAEKLVYLHIVDGKATLEDASRLAGKGTFDTDSWLRRKYGEDGFDHHVSVASIGPAGENMVRFACLANDRGHIAATGGLGALMGSKKLKAIVVQGTLPIPIDPADEERFLENTVRWREEAHNTGMGKTTGKFGTIGSFLNFHSKGWVPVKNLTTNIFPGTEKFHVDYIRKKAHRSVPRSCYNCTFVHCHSVQVTRGPYKGAVGEEVEYEILAGFGPNWGIYDPGTTTMLNTLNDDLGMDAKELTFLVSMMMEGYEKGFVTRKDLDGIDLQWGNTEAAVEMMKRISRREGIGAILAEGVKRASDRLGGGFPDIAVYVKKGNAPHIHDPRSRWGTIFNQVVSNAGSQEAQDLTARGSADLEIDKPTADPDEYLGAVNAKSAWWRQFQECLIYCYYQTATGKTMIETLNTLTGSDYDMEQALKIGRRVVNLMRMFNIREGMTKGHDSFSPRLGTPPVDGPAMGKTIAPTFERVLQSYYKTSGWDQEGRPTRELLEELGLSFAVPALKK
ncbi:MAG: putative oxidoreductase YdhV [Syntrophaceae bacterium PtaU1.Bin231]|nr:MAG: putative oxidoreductase YdhV [Syntrophaceae bacterium PtaU1.Bin231]HOG18703.1 aldehyde ferredoxin oxidoreductase C-terminal domain-containing protein [Syntrophales bacterium]